MAGSAPEYTPVKEHGPKSEVDAIRRNLNRLINDVEAIRAGAGTIMVTYVVDDLAVGADFYQRPIWLAPGAGALTLVDAQVFWEEAVAGVDATNTIFVQVRRIGELNATLTRTTNTSGHEIDGMTINNPNLVSTGVVWLDVTQTGTANAGKFFVQLTFRPVALDAAADLTAAKVNPDPLTGI